MIIINSHKARDEKTVNCWCVYLFFSVSACEVII